MFVALFIAVGLFFAAWYVLFLLTKPKFPPFVSLKEAISRSSAPLLSATSSATSAPTASPRSPVYAITGGSGLIGSELIKILLQTWDNTRTGTTQPPRFASIAKDLPEGTLKLLIRPSAKNQALVKEWKLQWPWAAKLFDITWAEGQSLLACESFIDDSVTLVFHIAAAGGDWGPINDFYQANEVTTRNLLQVCLQQAPHLRRFVHVSTVDIYAKHLLPIQCVPDRNTPLDLDSDFGYTTTKARADVLVCEAQDMGLETVILRPAAVYGDGSYSFGGTEAKETYAGRMRCVDQGKAVSGLVHVNDVARALLLASTAPEAKNRIYNLSDPSTGTWKNFYDFIARSLGKPPVPSLPWVLAWLLAVGGETAFRVMKITDRRPLATRFVLALVSRDQLWPIASCQKDFLWQPEIPFEDGMRSMCDYILANKFYLPN